MAGLQPEDEPGVIRFDIRDELSFVKFISKLRHTLSSRNDGPNPDINSGRQDGLQHSTQKHPLLRTQARLACDLAAENWLRIELVTEQGETTTLAMRDDNLYVHGFRNNNGHWYELLEKAETQRVLPPTLFQNPKRLDKWGPKYTVLLYPREKASRIEVVKKLKKLLCKSGKDFIVHAVKKLSDFEPGVSHISTASDPLRSMGARVALAGLIVMVCESARFNPLHDYFARGWTRGNIGSTDGCLSCFLRRQCREEEMQKNIEERKYIEGDRADCISCDINKNKGEQFAAELMLDHVWDYKNKSTTLLQWSGDDVKILNALLDTCLVLN